jgi:hypothetical protein
MAQPAADLFVLAPDRPEVTLVVEVKVGRVDLVSVEAQVRTYMMARRCPTALIVTPALTRVYADSYSDYSPDSIRLVGEFPTSLLMGIASVPTTGTELERAVKDWLDQLSTTWSSALPADEAARRVVVEHLVPAVVEGRVFASGTQ